MGISKLANRERAACLRCKKQALNYNGLTFYSQNYKKKKLGYLTSL